MNSKSLFWLLITILLITLVSAEAQQPKKVPLIGYLSPFDQARESTRAEAIRVALRRSWGERLSTHTWRAKIFSSAAQISGIYTVATSQTMRKSTLA